MKAEPPYPLELLGWKAFQDLCGTVLSEVLGQTYEILEAGRDGGRDGGFRGTWKTTASEAISGLFVVQCKHTAHPETPLTQSKLGAETRKARRLKKQGLVDVYVLMTNHRVTGEQKASIEAWFQAETGIAQVIIYGSAWLTQRILESDRLRMLVPRLYGLGDLGQILDERAYKQAERLLVSLQEDLRKFVPTLSYRQAARALGEHGFVLLLGEPAAGKTTIAATLALTAVDLWGCKVVRVDEPGEFVSHWNPSEPSQFFWVEDGFGATQYQQSLANQWNQITPKLLAAIRGGARVVLTSRDYIYREARHDLKEGAFPLLKESRVVIDIEELSLDEKAEILYNHVRLGEQPRSFRRKVKPHLPLVAHLRGFSPEAARRLGSPAFTKKLALSEQSLTDFIENKQDFLIETIRSLSSDHRGALILLFMCGGHLESPLLPSSEIEQKTSRLGTSVFGVAQALQVMNGSFVREEWVDEARSWTFRHPTMRDAISALIQEEANLLDVYLEGATDAELFSEVICGDVNARNAKVRVPASFFESVSARLRSRILGHYAWDSQERRLQELGYFFLSNRCSSSFLKHFFDTTPGFLESLTNVGSYLSAISRTHLLASVAEKGLLPESLRLDYVDRVSNLAVETPDADWVRIDSRFGAGMLMTRDERLVILRRVYEELVPRLEEVVDEHWWNAPHSSVREAEEHMDMLTDALRRYKSAFEETPEFNDAIPLIEEAEELISTRLLEIDEDDEDSEHDREPFDPELSERVHFASGGRDPFDDVDQ